MSDEPIDGTLVDEAAHTPAPDMEQSAYGTALARRERRSEVIRPLDADQLVESFHEYQALLPRILADSDYQAAEAGKKFVKKSGWRKIATAFDLDVQIVAEEVDRDDNGRILRAKTTARATSPSGRIMEGDGYCTLDEFTGRRASNPKLENDLRGTAATRAKNRAISDLVGMGDVSAEEAVEVAGAAVPWWAAPATDERKRVLLEATAEIIGNRELARELLTGISGSLGVMPDVLPAFAKALNGTVQAYRTSDPDPQPDGDGEGPRDDEELAAQEKLV
jgi:hypothetical protein